MALPQFRSPRYPRPDTSEPERWFSYRPSGMRQIVKREQEGRQAGATMASIRFFSFLVAKHFAPAGFIAENARIKIGGLGKRMVLWGFSIPVSAPLSER